MKVKTVSEQAGQRELGGNNQCGVDAHKVESIFIHFIENIYDVSCAKAEFILQEETLLGLKQ